jgi:hypothetical protein
MGLPWKNSIYIFLKVNIRPKIMDHVSIGYAYNSSVYWFLVHKSSIEYIHPNTIMIEKNDAFFVM